MKVSEAINMLKQMDIDDDVFIGYKPPYTPVGNIVSALSFRSKPRLDMTDDMFRVTIDMPYNEYYKLKTLLKGNSK
jgi:hypothetical protein